MAGPGLAASPRSLARATPGDPSLARQPSSSRSGGARCSADLQVQARCRPGGGQVQARLLGNEDKLDFFHQNLSNLVVPSDQYLCLQNQKKQDQNYSPLCFLKVRKVHR